jgi:hypothetical protein
MQYDVAIHFYARLLFRGFHVLRRNVAQVGNVAQIEAEGFAHEHIERHLIDGRTVRIYVAKSVHMRAHMLEHCDKIGLESHRVARDAEIERLGVFVAHVCGDDRPLKQLLARSRALASAPAFCSGSIGRLSELMSSLAIEELAGSAAWMVDERAMADAFDRRGRVATCISSIV